jgi:hypothetical protein
VIKIGEFVSNSGSLRISDPCYERDTWCSGVVNNCLTGKWEAFIDKQVKKGWGDRVTRLTVRAVGAEGNGYSEHLKIDVGVDSGQAGIFDDKLYLSNMKTPHLLTGGKEYHRKQYEFRLEELQSLDRTSTENDLIDRRIDQVIAHLTEYDEASPGSSVDFYDVCCDKTLSNLGAGTVEYGAVSSSGFGDGSYSAYAAYTDDGKVCEIYIDFITDEDEHEDYE